METALKRLLKTKTVLLFIGLTTVSILILWIRIQLVENETIAYQIMQEQGRFGLFSFLNSLKFLSIPFGYAFKLSLIAFILWTGAFLYGYKISFEQMWKIAILGEFVFLLAEFAKIIWLLAIPHDITIWDIKAFYPLSLMSLFDINVIPENWVYPLQSINLFEPLSWLVLVYGIHCTANKKLDYAYAIVFTTYVPVFLIWLGYYAIVYK
ncbi:hypothetical protein MNBD_BACTEROID06-1354 [hydrothermal vent metagenome]|uniref:Yip1 domain-containing protein n=1 Tax=hydrothermal vent metagenome TaxID=652676 RepID=A0A3B0UH46_9ZZZZ